MAMTIVGLTRPVVGGVDTHLDVHVAAVVDSIGGVLGVESFPVTRAGYAALSSWMAGFGALQRVGIEGTGSYGAGLSRHFTTAGVEVIEVDRANRQQRRRNGKSDELDAIEAARGALSGRVTGVAKSRDGNVEALRALLVAKRSARSARIASIVQLRHLMFTAPDALRDRFDRLRAEALVREASRLKPRPGPDPVLYATKTTAVVLARRVQALDAEIATLDRQIAPLVKATAPALLNIYGAGTDTAATLLVAAGDNAGRIRTEGAWAKICGVAPVPANTGKRDDRFRLNIGGNRHANNALWHIVFTRLGQHEPRTVAYMQRRLAQGKSKPEIIRCLKRYVAREVFSALPR
jgi:transposase